LHGFNVVAGIAAGLDGYEDALDDLELDLIECLMPTEGVPLEWTPRGIPQLTLGPPEQVPPGDGLSAATVVLPVHLHVFIESPMLDRAATHDQSSNTSRSQGMHAREEAHPCRQGASARRKDPPACPPGRVHRAQAGRRQH